MVIFYPYKTFFHNKRKFEWDLFIYGHRSNENKKTKKKLGLTDILIWKNTIRYLNTNGGWTRVVIAFFLSFFSTWMEPHLNNMLLLFEMIILNNIEWKWHESFLIFKLSVNEQVGMKQLLDNVKRVILTSHEIVNWWQKRLNYNKNIHD